MTIENGAPAGIEVHMLTANGCVFKQKAMKGVRRAHARIISQTTLCAPEGSAFVKKDHIAGSASS
jgi:hypothetical protein